LKLVSFGMIFYTSFTLALKLIDFSQINDRLAKYEDSEHFTTDHEKFHSLYFSVNYLSLALSFFEVLASIYINRNLVQTFNSTNYTRFICACFVLILVYLMIMIYFLTAFFKLSGFNLMTFI